MSFPSSLARVCFFGAASAIVAAGALATPSDSEPQIIERSIAAATEVPDVDLPDVGESAHEGPAPVADVDSRPEAETEPPHLNPSPDAAAEPAAVVTTTTPPTTTPPTTTNVAPPTTTTTAAPPATTTAPPATTTVAPVVTVAFSATQAYGSCGEGVPYDIFSGTATPGSTITISSPYGSGTTTADADGHWKRTVEFPNAPTNEPFTVTVNGSGGSKTMSFVATGDAHA